LRSDNPETGPRSGSGLAFPEVKLIQSKRFADARGWFNEIYADDLAAPGALLAGIDFVQDNASLSVHPGTVRGLHFQMPPFGQGKLVTVLTGAVFDVTVDIRRASPTFGRYMAVELRAGTGQQLFVPVGFAHGFMTLVPDTVVFYKVTSRYAPNADRGILWNDPELGIAWPRVASEVQLSDKDRVLPTLRTATDLFP